MNNKLTWGGVLHLAILPERREVFNFYTSTSFKKTIGDYYG